MVIKNDKQRKAMFARMNQNQPRAQTRPTIIQRIRRRVKPTPEELRAERGRRLSREAEELRRARIRTQQLELEANLERERERVREREERARLELKRIDTARREKTFAGRVLRVERAVVRRGVEAGRRAIQARRAKPRKRRRRVAPREEVGFFGIR